MTQIVIRQLHFNPRSPQGGATYANREAVTTANTFQSTLPARGSDSPPSGVIVPQGGFQSTLPARGSDAPSASWRARRCISIHAPRKGERQALLRSLPASRRFQSTLPARGSDRWQRQPQISQYQFQSTLPARGSDRADNERCYKGLQFQSTLPARGSDTEQADV